MFLILVITKSSYGKKLIAREFLSIAKQGYLRHLRAVNLKPYCFLEIEESGRPINR